MSYTALYRKYRPSEFTDVKGQDHIVTTLTNQIKAGRIGHAYLFCGTRGTGKTTVAKIFARAVNCDNPQNGNPCGECEVCRRISSGASLNVIEIDAASNNGVDDVRQIREEVTYPPTEGKYKVYIIDEVHMLSTGAFNALLKTLEEPPSYVIFILATTEAHKIPVTILSRCQRYDFHRITADTIAARLTELMKTEGTQVEEKAIRYIAKAADGSMRDALSLLDQCISFYLGQSLTYENVLEVLGAADTTVFSQLLEAVLTDDVARAMSVIDELVRQGRELSQFVTDFIGFLRSLLLLKSSDQIEDILDTTEENLSLLKEMAKSISDEGLMRYIRVFSDLLNDMRYAAQKRILLEIAVIRLCKPEMDRDQDALLDRIEVLERKIERGIPAAPAASAAQTRPVEEIPKAERPTIRPEAIPDDIRRVVREWRKITDGLPGVVRAYARMANLTLGDDGKLVLVFADEIAYTYLSNEAHRQDLADRISEKIGKEVAVRVVKQAPGRSFEQNYIDLTKIIHNIDIEIEEE
ncbi:MAG: DNA polymerase III subunit gamma/tau [Eubacterium sp.]|nr:DNA polymerase III subunit gamma/tau [Eubacterium sp.]